MAKTCSIKKKGEDPMQPTDSEVRAGRQSRRAQNHAGSSILCSVRLWPLIIRKLFAQSLAKIKICRAKAVWLCQRDHGVANTSYSVAVPDARCPPLRIPCVIRGTHANFSGGVPRHDSQRLAGCPQLLAARCGGHCANVSGGTLITHQALAAEG